MSLNNTETFGVFVGRGEYTTLDDLAEQRMRDGWLICDEFDAEFTRKFIPSCGKKVIVNGSSTGECVAKVVKLALDNGAKQVIVPLNEVQQGFTDDLNSVEHMTHNALLLALSIRSGGYIDDDRLLVVPTEIWDAVQSQVER